MCRSRVCRARISLVPRCIGRRRRRSRLARVSTSPRELENIPVLSAKPFSLRVHSSDRHVDRHRFRPKLHDVSKFSPSLSLSLYTFALWDKVFLPSSWNLEFSSTREIGEESVSSLVTRMKRLKCSSATAQVSVPPLSPRSGRDLIFYRVPRPEISAIAPLAGWGWRNVVSRTSRVLVRVNFEFGIREVIREEGKRDFSPCCCVREQLKKLALSSDRDHRSIRWMSEWGRSEEAEGMMRAQGSCL